ncbi:Protein of unknown function [Rhizobiales bacterium GAS191]|jgi:hypothetical protein|nr:Protein of unknown function [Rhizobiales bacterium GAS113]SED86682.1 Protein of unknown function [Rhizobiales bacterium GAS191]
MSARMRLTAGIVGVIGIIAGFAAPAYAQGGVKIGTLNCKSSAGTGFVFGSSRTLACDFAPSAGRRERYAGEISKFGVDIGYTPASVILWQVVAPTARLAPGSLAGNYGGATAGASVGAGLGANALIGGSNQQITLQPLSVDSKTGLNLAVGIASIALRPGR